MCNHCAPLDADAVFMRVKIITLRQKQILAKDRIMASEMKIDYTIIYIYVELEMYC